MSEELKIAEILEMFEEFPTLTPLQRVILSSTTTVQSMLSVIFKTPVVAQLIAQKSFGNVDIRWVRLVTKKDNKVVCLAESVLPHETNDKDFLEELREGKEGGIGMIITRRGIKTERTIWGIYADEHVFTRVYSLKGDGVDVTITEVFPNGIYEDLS